MMLTSGYSFDWLEPLTFPQYCRETICFLTVLILFYVFPFTPRLAMNFDFRVVL